MRGIPAPDYGGHALLVSDSEPGYFYIVNAKWCTRSIVLGWLPHPLSVASGPLVTRRGSHRHRFCEIKCLHLCGESSFPYPRRATCLTSDNCHRTSGSVDRDPHSGASAAL